MKDTSEVIPAYDSACYLCPGNARVSDAENPAFDGVFVFDNDHPCVSPDAPEPTSESPFYVARAASGVARVVCFSPGHGTTLAEMAPDKIDQVMAVLQEQYRELGARSDISHVLMSENKGEAVGVSNPHPHGLTCPHLCVHIRS